MTNSKEYKQTNNRAQISTVVVLADVVELVVVAIFVVDKNVGNVVDLVDDIVVEVVDPVIGIFGRT